MIVLESNNPEELKIGWFDYVPKNRVNSENWKLVCEHLSQENTLYLPVIGISQISVSNGSKSIFSFGEKSQSIYCRCYNYWRGKINDSRLHRHSKLFLGVDPPS